MEDQDSELTDEQFQQVMAAAQARMDEATEGPAYDALFDICLRMVGNVRCDDHSFELAAELADGHVFDVLLFEEKRKLLDVLKQN